MKEKKLNKEQYRMHPKISQFISFCFYKSSLKNAKILMELIKEPEIYSKIIFSPLIFFHVEVKIKK